MEKTEEKTKRKRKAPKRTSIPDPQVILNNEYSVRLDPRCLVLYRKRSQEENSTDEIIDDIDKADRAAGIETLGYYSTWEALASAIIKNKTRNTLKFSSQDTYTLSLFIKTLQDTVKEVKDIFKDIDRLETESIKITKISKEEKMKELRD